MSATVRVTRSRSAIRTATEGTTESLQLSATPAPRQTRRKPNLPSTIIEDTTLPLALDSQPPASITPTAEATSTSTSYLRTSNVSATTAASFTTPSRSSASASRLPVMTPNPKPVTRLPDSCHSISEYGNRALFTPTGDKYDPNKNRLTQTSYSDGQVYGTDACGCKPTQHCEHKTYNAFKDRAENIELTRAAATPRKAPIFHSAAHDDYWSDVYDVFPFVFLSPTLTVGVMKLLRRDPATIASFEDAVQRSRQRPLCRRAYAYLKYVVLLVAVAAAYRYYVATKDKAILSNGMELTSGDVAALLDVYDMSRNPALSKMLAARVDSLANDIRAFIIKGDEQDKQYADTISKAARLELGKLVEAQIAALRTEQSKAAQEQQTTFKTIDAENKGAVKGLTAAQEALRNDMTAMTKQSTAALEAAQRKVTAAIADARSAITGEYTELIQKQTKAVEEQVRAVAAAVKEGDASLRKRVEVLEGQMKAAEAQFVDLGKENKQHAVKVLNATKVVVAEAKKELKAYADAAATQAIETAQKAMEAKVNGEVVKALQSSEGILDRVMAQVQQQITSGDVLSKLIDNIKKQVANEAQEQAVAKARVAAEELGQALFERSVAAAKKAAQEEALAATEKAIAAANANLEKLNANAKAAKDLELKELHDDYAAKITTLQRAVESMQSELKGKYVAAAREGKELDVKQSLLTQVQETADRAAKDAKEAYALAQRAMQDMEGKVAAAVKTAVSELAERLSTVEGRVEAHAGRLDKLEAGAKRMTELYEELKQGKATVAMDGVSAAAQKLAADVESLRSGLQNVTEIAGAAQQDAIAAKKDAVAAQKDAAAAQKDAAAAQKDAAAAQKDAADAQKDVAAFAKQFSAVKTAAEEGKSIAEAMKKDVTLIRHQQLQQTAAVDALKAAVVASDVDKKIDRALELFAADRTGMVDYAVKANGGRIFDHSATHYKTPYNNAVVNFLTTCFQPVQAPDLVIDPSAEVGSCWPMNGQQGFITLRLKLPVAVTHVTLQHVRHSVTATPGTAPRAFRVFGLSAEEARVRTGDTHPDTVGTLLGDFEYKMDIEADEQKSVQTFAVADTGKAFQYIKFQIDSNYGAEDFTCLYRLRVHGKWIKA